MYLQIEYRNQTFKYVINDIKHDNLIGDSIRTIQVINDFMSNAMKFTPSEGTIQFIVNEIDSNNEKAYFQFVVTDTGKGMDEEYLDRIFVPFEQENPSISKQYGGTGLGMSIGNSLVRIMGGSVLVESKLEVGTKITIDIPYDINPNGKSS